ncbi:DoxX family protein [Candidatus Uhrbacteria bacterium]|nr:DoxX family protein [Candidatus Uhrbacteria bacterium]
MKQYCYSAQGRDLALFLLRLAAGAVFIYHGWLKLDDMQATQAFFESLNIPVVAVAAWVVALVEFVGGIALVLGVHARSGAFLLGINMIVALLVAHLGKPFLAAELPLVLLGAMFVVWTHGAGAWRLMKQEWFFRQ